MKEKLLNNIGIKILSVIIAIILWLIVVNIEDPVVTREFKGIKVTVINEEEVSEIDKVYEIIDGDTVDITVKGKRTIVDNLSASDFVATADLGKLSDVYAVQVRVTPTKSSLKDDLEITCKDNDTLKVKLEDKLTKQLSVTVVTQGTPAIGYAIGGEKVTVKSPNIIEISGAESLVNKVKEARVVVSVDGVSTDFDTIESISLRDSDGDEVSGTERLTVSASEVNVSMKIFKTKEVPVNLNLQGSVDENYSIASVDYEPKTVLIAGSDEDLAQIDSIDINDVSIDKITENLEAPVIIDDYLPNTVTTAEANSSVNVAVKLEKKTTKVITFTASDLLYNGKDDSKNYTLQADNKYTVTISGAQSVISDVTISDLKPTVNCDSLVNGTSTVNIKFADVEYVNIDSSGQIKIKVESK